MEVIIRDNILDGIKEDEKTSFSERLEIVRSQKPMEDWKIRIVATDAKVPRAVEDIYDVLTPEQKAALPEILRANVTDKKRIRSEKPKE